MARMSMKEFGRLVRRVMETLPAEFEPYLDNLNVDIAEAPTPRTLRRLGFTPLDIREMRDEDAALFGLFCPLVPGDANLPGADFDNPPRTLVIFKEPHEEEFPDPKECRIEIRKTVIHELAHHFGFDEDDLEKFDDNPDPFGEN